jgi:hypothetical protein
MLKTIKFKYKNIVNPQQTYESVHEFFKNAGNDDMDALNSYKLNDDMYLLEDSSYLLDDKKTVTVIKVFYSGDDANRWIENRNKLPKIDKNLSEEIVN